MPHNHRHDYPSANYNLAFAIGVGLNVLYVVVEAAFGLIVGSLALLADAGHNLSDVLGLLMAWGAHYLAQRKPTDKHTYGLRSSSILAALSNALLLLVAVGGIMWEAIRRFADPPPIDGTTVIWVAGVGVVINTITALLFLKGRERDLNIRGAFLHMAADAGVSAGVVIAGVVIYYTKLHWIDPLVSLGVALVILIGTWGLLKDSVDLALHAVPKGMDTQAVRDYLCNLPGVNDVHDLHIWAMSTTETALTAHLVRPDDGESDSLLADIATHLHEEFRIAHVTIQIERNEQAAQCRQAPPEAV